MDKASILGDAIEYVNQLRKKIQDLEARARQMEADQPSRMAVDSQIKSSSLKSVADKRKLRIVKESGSAKPKAVDSPPQRVAEDGGQVDVEVSIIESDALVELRCPYREGLLLDVMQMLLELRVEITTVQSSLTNGVFVSELRAKVKENVNGKKASILEVKKAIQQIIPQ
ncbi:hypothetical protein F0562_002564 [Nyssa sinensis]|uniref:Plant bHLH transcription factor ACT-like domain-containing protein n=1 Tax=Nyssa sinensis TaxID=561372 RepID=A0A5J5C9Z0_9ASTE|nr:hypothetical protein F0562_002564 [Nyssa sinensis]